MKPMTSSIKKLALSLGLALASGFAFTPLGCGSSRGGVGSAAAGHGDAAVPEGIALEIRTCVAKHVAHLGSGEQSVSFDVKLSHDGEVDSVALRESTLGDEELEACMVSALRSMSEGDLPTRLSYSHPRGPVAPESRALVGQVQALDCLVTPPCLLVVAFFVGAAYIAVQIYVHAAQSSTAKPKPRTAPTATTMPTVTTMPTAAPVDDERERCKKAKEECLDTCSDTALPTRDFGTTFHRCMRACMEAKGCVY